MNNDVKNYFVPDLIHDLLTAAEDGLDELTRKLSEYFSLPIIISDSFYKVISSSITNQMEMFVIPHFEGMQNTGFFKCNLELNGMSYEGFGCPIKGKNQPFGYLFLLAKHEDVSMIEQHISLLQYTASLCLLHFKQQEEIKKEKHHYKDAFLFDILYGNFKIKEDIVSYGSLWKWNLEQPHMAIVFSLLDYNHYSFDKQLIEALLYIIEKSLTQHGMEPITIKKQGEIIAMVPVNEHTHFDKKKRIVEFIEYLFAFTEDSQLKDRVACGVGQIYENPTELYRSYQEAKVAYELGTLLRIKIPFFHHLGLERILYKHDLQDLREFYHHVVGDLQRYDEENSGELMNTLESFAHHQFDLKQTSEAIFLHRNTLRYRIKKIEEILNLKLDDMNNRLNITAALKIKQLHKM